MKSVRQLGSLVVAVSLLSAANAAAVSKKDAHCDFLPKNNLNIPVGMELSGGITEKQFNGVIDKVIAFYAPIIKSKGAKLKMNRLWTDGTVNASAQQTGKTWIVNMYGGLARHSVTTQDGFALVLCHEIGHHLGGYPQIGVTEGSPDWAANEGQADYFATMKCFRRAYEADKAENAAVVSALSIPATVKTKCSDTFKSTDEINLCVREAMGGQVLANLLWTLGGSSGKKPAFDTPDPSKVSEMNDAHPKAQCRLDTYFNGSFCGINYTQDFGTKDASTGACAQESGDKFGFRPLCWYKPQ